MINVLNEETKQADSQPEAALPKYLVLLEEVDRLHHVVARLKRLAVVINEGNVPDNEANNVTKPPAQQYSLREVLENEPQHIESIRVEMMKAINEIEGALFG